MHQQTSNHAHHIQHWSRGGETKMDNLVSLCRHHHRLMHEGGFGLEISTTGKLSFFSPSEKRLFDSHLLPVADSTVETGNRIYGVTCDRNTAAGLWQGERIDLALAVHGLLMDDNSAVDRAATLQCGD